MKIQSQKATNIQIKLKEITGECIVQCAPNQTWISQIGLAELNCDADTCCNCWRDSESLIIISILDGVVTCLPTHSFMKIKISYFKIIILGRVFLRKSKNTCDRWCMRCNHVDLIYSSIATTTGTEWSVFEPPVRPCVCVFLKNGKRAICNQWNLFFIVWQMLWLVYRWRCSRQKLMPMKWKVIMEKWFAFVVCHIWSMNKCSIKNPLSLSSITLSSITLMLCLFANPR